MSKGNRNRQPQAAASTAPAATPQATEWPVDGNGAPVANDNQQAEAADEIGSGAPVMETPEQYRERLLALAAVFTIEDADAMTDDELATAVEAEGEILKETAKALGVEYVGEGSLDDIRAHIGDVLAAFDAMLERANAVDVGPAPPDARDMAEWIAAIEAAESAPPSSEPLADPETDADTEPGDPEPEPIQPGDRVRVHGDRNVMDPEVMDATVTAVWGDGCVDVKEGWRVFSKVPPQGSVPEGRRCFVRL